MNYVIVNILNHVIDARSTVLTFVNSTFVWKRERCTEHDKVLEEEGNLKIDNFCPHHRTYKYDYCNSKVVRLPQFADEVKKIGVIVENNQGKYKAYHVRAKTDEDRERQCSK